MSSGLLFAIGCALAALAYGIHSSKWIMSLPTGNDRMRQIAAAVQEGAQAYLKRQYTTIAWVGVVLAILIGIFLGAPTAIGFIIGAVLSGAVRIPGSARRWFPSREHWQDENRLVRPAPRILPAFVISPR